MRATTIVFAFLLTYAGAASAQQEAVATSHDRAAAELIAVLQLEHITAASIRTLTESMVTQNPALAQLRDVFIEFFTEFMRWDELRPEYVRIYREAYAEAELRELIAFYKTPIGQKTVELMPRLFQQGAEIGQKQIEPHLPELQRRIEARLRGGVQPYYP
jgi:uncharacterized protein